ncbi:MAG: DUF2244 domain-containing protein [Pseudomonadota bacterium]
MTKPPAAPVGLGKRPAAGAGEGWAARKDAPAWSVELWPNRSLTAVGRKRVLWIMAGGFCVPLAPIALTPVVWIPLAFALVVLCAVAFALRLNSDEARLIERVTLWPDEMRVERIEPKGKRLRWSADPYFVRLHVHSEARLENYLTLTGGTREIELGAFLAPDERVQLAEELEAAIRRALRGEAVSAQSA